MAVQLREVSVILGKQRVLCETSLQVEHAEWLGLIYFA